VLTLRDYQRASLDALYAYWADGGGNGLIVLPTGAGKSLVIAALVHELLQGWPDLRICIVTHVRELIAQDFKELIGFWPGAPAGIYSAGLGQRDAHARILFCGIQSVWNKVGRLGAFDAVIVDEAHLIPRKADTSYGRFLESLRHLTPDLRVVGLTASPYRLDSGCLDQGDGALFDRVVYDANVGDLIQAGYSPRRRAPSSGPTGRCSAPPGSRLRRSAARACRSLGPPTCSASPIT
jgi:DNA repair protein RadD